MTRDEALEALKEIAAHTDFDPEVHHLNADQILVRLINDPEIAAAYCNIAKWYA